MSSPLSLALSLVGSLLLGAPTLVGFLRGDIAPDIACIRYVIAFVLARLGVSVVSRLLVNYMTQAHQGAYVAMQLAAQEATE